MRFAVIGGDMRHAGLADLLARDGHAVTTFALDKISPADGVRQADTAKKAVEETDCVILPLPVSTREGMLNTPLSGGLHTTREIVSVLRPEQVICAGRVDSTTHELAEAAGLTFTDYLEREEFAVANAVAVAEGAIQLIMEETPITLCHSRCLVIGYGRIGKALCHRLKGLGADVTASARSAADLAWIRAFGYTPVKTAELDGNLADYDVVVNTVPFRVFGEQRLREVKADCLCLDLASKPGGIDFAAASSLGVKAMWALSLPGEVAPATSGVIIRDTIYNILSERGLMV